MKIQTRLFGEVEFDPQKVIHFPEGLIGLNNLKDFFLIDDENIAPFQWFQSIDEPTLAFVVINPFFYKEDFKVPHLHEHFNLLSAVNEDSLTYLTIVVLTKQLEGITANLKGPMVINTDNFRAVQVVIDSHDYPTKYPVFRNVQPLGNT
jgi:flagellar assembly factor FliW